MIPFYNNQFLLLHSSLQPITLTDGWNCFKIDEHHLLYAHPNLSVSYCIGENQSVFGLGDFYDYRNTRSNQEIIDDFYLFNDTDRIINEYSNMCGENILIVKSYDHLILVNDANAQREVYYSTDFKVMASMPTLIGQVMELLPHESTEAKAYFESKKYVAQQIDHGDTTAYSNVKHLIANHYLDIRDQKVCRFYPNKQIVHQPKELVVEETEAIIIGYLRAIASRKTIAIPLTAGIDSRVLVCCAIKAGLENAIFYVYQNPLYNGNKVDVQIAKEIARALQVPLKIIDVDPNERHPREEEAKAVLKASINLEHVQTIRSLLSIDDALPHSHYAIINGGIVGTGKNFYVWLPKLTPKDLSMLIGFDKVGFVLNILDEWLSNSREHFKTHKVNILDMFYWEERASNWGAKGARANRYLSNNISIFNSRKLFDTMFQIPRKYRYTLDYYLFDKILVKSGLPFQHIPINPSRKRTLMTLALKSGLYIYYRFVGIKLGLIKFNKLKH